MIYVVDSDGSSGSMKGCNGGVAHWQFDTEGQDGTNTYDASASTGSGRLVVSEAQYRGRPVALLTLANCCLYRLGGPAARPTR